MEPEGPTPSQQKKGKLNSSWRPETQAPPTPAVPVGAQENESQRLSSQDAKLLSGTFGTFLCNMKVKIIIILIYKPRCTVLQSRVLNPFEDLDVCEHQIKVINPF